jgi:hypothetical protein
MLGPNDIHEMDRSLGVGPPVHIITYTGAKCRWAVHGEFVLNRNKAKTVNDHVYVPVHVHVKVHVFENLP